MSLQLLEEPITCAPGDSETVHIFCPCSPDMALCGEDLSDVPFDDGDDVCVVCADLDRLPCERCGT